SHQLQLFIQHVHPRVGDRFSNRYFAPALRFLFLHSIATAERRPFRRSISVDQLAFRQLLHPLPHRSRRPHPSPRLPPTTPPPRPHPPAPPPQGPPPPPTPRKNNPAASHSVLTLSLF